MHGVTPELDDRTWNRSEPPRRRRNWKVWILGLVVLLVAGYLAAVVVKTLSDDSHGQDTHPLTAQETAHAITAIEASSIPLGSSRDSVESALGRTPEERTVLAAAGVQTNPSCVYYNIVGEDCPSYIQLCFRQGLLISYTSSESKQLTPAPKRREGGTVRHRWDRGSSAVGQLGSWVHNVRVAEHEYSGR